MIVNKYGQPDNLDIHIFENMPVGIQSTRKAVDMVKEMGINAQLTAWEIAHNQIMDPVLKAQGAQVFDDINPAVQRFFKLIEH